MKKLTVYERPEELGSIILGVNVDANRKRFDDMIPTLEAQGVEVVRYNAIDNPEHLKGKETLPAFEILGELKVQGRYPQVFEVAQWFDIAKESFQVEARSSLFVEANTAYGGPCCGVNADLYLDPNADPYEPK